MQFRGWALTYEPGDHSWCPGCGLDPQGAACSRQPINDVSPIIDISVSPCPIHSEINKRRLLFFFKERKNKKNIRWKFQLFGVREYALLHTNIL